MSSDGSIYFGLYPKVKEEPANGSRCEFLSPLAHSLTLWQSEAPQEIGSSVALVRFLHSSASAPSPIRTASLLCKRWADRDFRGVAFTNYTTVLLGNRMKPFGQTLIYYVDSSALQVLPHQSSDSSFSEIIPPLLPSRTFMTL